MRKSWFLLPALAYIVAFSFPVAAQWNIWTVHSPNVGEHTSLELDSQGYPHISYYDGANGSLLYAWYDGAINIDTVDQAGDVGKYSSLELDTLERAHIAYYADFPARDLKYAYWDGSAWNIATVDTGNIRDTGISLVLEPGNNYRHISYCKADNLWYAFFDGVSWSTSQVTADPFSGYDSSIDLDPTNNYYACISYIDAGNGWLRYAYYDGTGWQLQTPDNTPSPGYTSLDVDPTGVAHIAYSRLDPTPPFPRELRYAWGTPGSWNRETIPYGSTNYGSFCSIRADVSNNPRISFSDDLNADLLFAAKNGAWGVEPVDQAGGVGQYTSLALQNQVVPHISYYGVTNTALKYAFKSVFDIGPDSILVPTDTVAPGGYNPQVRIRNFGNAVSSPCDAIIAIAPSYVCTTQVGAIPVGGTEIAIFLTPWTEFTFGTYDIMVWTTLVDSVPSNDTLHGQVVVWEAVHDCGSDTILSPPDLVLPGSNHPVDVQVTNFGNVQEIFTVRCWDIGVYSEVVTCTLDAGLSAVLSFPAWDAPGSEMTWTMCCSTQVAGDNDPSNDRFCKDIEVRAVHNAGVDTILNPPDMVDPSGGPYPVEAVVQNYGTLQEDSIAVKCTIDPDGYRDSTWVTMLAAGSVDTAIFVNWTPVTAGPWTMCCWTELIDDTIPGDDTLCKQIDPTGVEEFLQGPVIPRFLELSQNLPNPFHNATSITFGIPSSARATLRVYDLTGSLVRTLADAAHEAGFHTVAWDGRDENGLKVSSGMYFYRLTIGEFTATKKLTILR